MSRNTLYSLFLDSSRNITPSLSPAASIILAAKEMAERLGTDSSGRLKCIKGISKKKKTNKTIRHSGTQEWRTGRRLQRSDEGRSVQSGSRRNQYTAFTAVNRSYQEH